MSASRDVSLQWTEDRTAVYIDTFLPPVDCDDDPRKDPDFPTLSSAVYKGCKPTSPMKVVETDQGFRQADRASLVAFSCKGRVCPSCWARRTAETAADLVDRVLPQAPYRQWVLTFPWDLRFLLAVEPDFLSEMLATFLRTVFAWQRLQGRRVGLRGEAGSVTFTQRFGKLRSYCTSRTRIGSIFCRSAWFAPRPGSLAGLDTCRGRVVEVEPPDVPVVPVVLAAPV